MKEILVLSGKGGTGKTTVCASLIYYLKKPLVAADADVDASNVPLLLRPKVLHEEDFWAGWEPVKDEAKCTGCGTCLEKCRFGAVREDFSIDLSLCEGCGVCAWFCPEEALEMEEKEVGKIFLSETRYGPLVHAELYPGEENSGKLVTEVKKRAREWAEQEGRGLILVDGSPGVGCPVIASLSGADLVLLVAEPTLSGFHDLERLGALLKHFKIKGYLIVNKADLAPELTERLISLAEKEGFPLLGRIPYDEEVFESLHLACPLPEISQGKAAQALKEITIRVQNLIEEEAS